MSLFKTDFWQIPLVSFDVQESLAEKTATLKQRLHQIADNHHDARFASSLAVEDMVITDVIARENLDIGIFTLDTGLLHQDTLNLLGQLEKVYPHLQIERFQPIADEVIRYEEEKGNLLFMKAWNYVASVAISVKNRTVKSRDSRCRCMADRTASKQSATRTALPLLSKISLVVLINTILFLIGQKQMCGLIS